MIGLDTNVLLSLADRGHPRQTEAAQAIVSRRAEAGGCLLNPIVLAEFAWTLDRRYRLDRATIAIRLNGVLNSSEFVLPFAQEALSALEQYRNGSADFADYLLAEINRSLGCETTFTFDRAAARANGFTLLAA